MTERPKAAAFELRVCEDPNCGPHILALDEHDRCMAEIVIARKDIASFCRALQDVAYAKAVEQD
jgi:hypothetical protein